MSETTIGVSNELKATLQDIRLDTETSYEDTLWRLLDENPAEYPTKEEVEDIARNVANEQITEHVVREAQE